MWDDNQQQYLQIVCTVVRNIFAAAMEIINTTYLKGLMCLLTSSFEDFFNIPGNIYQIDTISSSYILKPSVFHIKTNIVGRNDEKKIIILMRNSKRNLW